ncbi:NAD(P)-binding domain-containing protein [Streptomyces sp. NPDC020412]|uniref:NAD(P)-binding domain-containing protein n=1 Tax=Streptomyces sp. NPDC020412 TaxID=3365073 RepID=UPI0037B4392C
MYDVAVIGAGPYGLSVAAHAAVAGMRLKVFGRPMATWRDHMPAGMFLKSEPWASNLSDPAADHTLARYGARAGFATEHGRPLPIGAFTAYGRWFAEHAVPGVDERTVTRVARLDGPGGGFAVHTADGDVVTARTAVVAVGLLPFARVPSELAGLGREHVCHSTGLRDLSGFRDRDVTVVGAGQAALETATLLAETGARPRLVARAHALNWNTLPVPRARAPHRKLRTPLSGLGSGWRSWAYSELPWAVRHLSAAKREHIARTALGPAGAWWLRERYEGTVPQLLGHALGGARVVDGRVRLTLAGRGGPVAVDTDHVVAATGFTPDLDRLALLDAPLRAGLATVGAGRAPELSGAFESSCAGLFFAGLLAAPSFGPSMRFVYGAEFTAPRLVTGLRTRLRAAAAFPPRQRPRPRASV